MHLSIHLSMHASMHLSMHASMHPCMHACLPYMQFPKATASCMKLFVHHTWNHMMIFLHAKHVRLNHLMHEVLAW